MLRCGQCGGRLRRVHRTFLERFSYMAIYECQVCLHEESVLHRYRYHLGPECRCPRCGTFRLVRLKERDRIDPLQTGVLNLAERLAGGRLYHCRFCRLQFYDRRPLASGESPTELPAEGQATVPGDTARSDA